MDQYPRGRADRLARHRHTRHHVVQARVGQCEAHHLAQAVPGPGPPRARGLHSSTFRLNVNDFCGIGGVFRGSLGGRGMSRVYFVSETAQVELKSGRV